MNFEKTVPEWNAQGTEPPSSLKTSGFSAGYKPPAPYFNWFWYSVSKCLAELQTSLSSVDNTADANKSVKYASSAGSANKVKSSIVVRLNGGSTEGTDMFTFDGSAGKSVNITPAKIGAAAATEAPVWVTYGTTTSADIETAYQTGRVVLCKTTDDYVGILFARANDTAHFFIAGNKVYRCFNNKWSDVTALYTFAPSSHADNHKTGGSDAIAPGDIGAAAKSSTITATLAATSWTGSEAPYTYTLTVSGVTTTSNQELLPALNITAEQLEALQGANIQDGGQAANSITLKAYGDKPEIDIPVRIVKRGD